MSDTLGGDLKTRKNAEVVIARSNQGSKAKKKLDDEVAFLYRKDQARIDALRREEQEARDALLRLNSSDHVNKERDKTNTALEEASSEQAQQEEKVRKIQVAISVKQNEISNLGGNLNSDVVGGIVSLKGDDEVKLSLANLFDSLGDEDKEKVVALRKKWHGGEGDYDSNSDEYKEQTGEALRQLLEKGDIKGNYSFNTGLNQLFVEQFPNQAIEIINKAQEDNEANELNRAQSELQQKQEEYARENKSLEESEKAKEKAIEEAEKWTPDNVENRREVLRNNINDPNTSDEQKAKDREELSKLTGTSGSLEEITAAMARVDTIKAKQNNLVKSSFGLRAIYAREQAGVAAGDRAKAEAEALNIVQATDIGSQLVDALNEVEFGRKQAEEFAQTLKNQKLNKVLSGAAKTMEKVLTKWNKEGKGNLKELDRMLSEASAKNVFVGASVQSQKLEEAKSEGVQASKK